jgi:ribosomal protein S12 methylthiotransferase accessory factor
VPAADLAVTPDVLRRLESFVSPYTGLVRATVEFLRAPHEASAGSVGCALAEGEELVGGPIPRYSAGAHWLPGAARAAAIGEALERYSATFVPEHDLVTGTAVELGLRAVEPSRFALFHEWQYEQAEFRFVPFRRDTRLRWARGWSLPGGEPALLPAQLVFMRPFRDDEPIIDVSTSNGVACAPTREGAVLGGLLEAIERDCFMIAWYDRLSLPRLDWSADRELVALERRYFAASGLRYALLDASPFFAVPTFVGVVRSDSVLGIGAGCAATSREAWRKAMNEAFSVHRWVEDKLVEEPERRPRRRDEIREFDDHVLFYADPEHAAHVDFLDASTETTDIRAIPEVAGDSPDECVAALCDRLSARDASAYAVDVTAPDVREAGLHVVRVVCPELCALDVLGWAPHLGGRRILHAAHEAGLLPAPLTLDDLNPWPHPFP